MSVRRSIQLFLVFQVLKKDICLFHAALALFHYFILTAHNAGFKFNNSIICNLIKSFCTLETNQYSKCVHADTP